MEANVRIAARTDAETFGVPVTTRNIISRYSFRSIFSTAHTHDVDLVITGWSDDAHLSPGRAERGIDDLTQDLPCDFLVLKGSGFDASRILVPTAGGPDSELSAEIARLLKAEYDSEITFLHVVNGDEEAENGRQFLTAWATEQGLLTRLLHGSLAFDIVESLDMPVLLTERSRDRSWKERILGVQT